MRRLLEMMLHLSRIPLLLGLIVTRNRDKIDADVQRWSECQSFNHGFLNLLSQAEFRSLYYHRLGEGENLAGKVLARLLAFVYRPQTALFIYTDDIGPGLYIQHGFSTMIAAKRIGANCWINQQVTIGYNTILEDDVTVTVGAKIIRRIHLGEDHSVTVGANSTVGANAVVINDVPPNTTAIGVPARYIPAR